jgi:6-pyruvoyltetrahydropterin/6-carboxytetrahydropterin synthase
MDDVQQGLLVDFSDLKGAVREVLNKFDHAFVLRSDDYALANWLVDNDHALVVLNVNPTAENLAQLVADELRGFLGLRFDVHVTVWETSKNSAEAYGQVDRVIQVIEVRNVPVI